MLTTHTPITYTHPTPPPPPRGGGGRYSNYQGSSYLGFKIWVGEEEKFSPCSAPPMAQLIHP